MEPSVVMATIISVTVSPCLIISATALYSAQIPIPHKRFIFTPVKMLPLEVSNAAPTQPIKLQSFLDSAIRRTSLVASNAHLISSLLLDIFPLPGSVISSCRINIWISLYARQRPLPQIVTKRGNTTIFLCDNCRKINEVDLSSFIFDKSFLPPLAKQPIYPFPLRSDHGG